MPRPSRRISNSAESAEPRSTSHPCRALLSRVASLEGAVVSARGWSPRNENADAGMGDTRAATTAAKPTAERRTLCRAVLAAPLPLPVEAQSVVDNPCGVILVTLFEL